MYGASVCRMYYFDQSAINQLYLQCFPDYGVWVSVDFDSKYKILWGETRAHDVVPICEEEEKFKTRIYIIIPIFTPPYSIRLTHVGVEGVCSLAEMASSRQLSFGWFIYLWTSMFLYSLWFRTT